jgi:hypothetical protein
LASTVAIASCGAQAEEATTAPPVTTQPPATAATTTTTLPQVEPPWAAASLPASEVPEVLAEQWEAAENQAGCAALYLEGIADVEPDAVPRAANFAGGWAIAWDRPDGPGMRADGTFCEECGRSAFGIAGAGIAADPAAVRAWPNVIEWSDGSIAGYGDEGFGSDQPVTDPITEGAVSPTKLAYLVVEGQSCLYNLWSRRSEEELLALIDRIRFVEGLGSP